jgi:phosphatidylserine decarboxylase
LKGDEIGYFNMGSTIVLVFEAPAAFELTVSPGEKLVLGQPISTL